MKLRKNAPAIIIFLFVISWILFVGLSIEAGTLLYNGIATQFFDKSNADFNQLDSLYQASELHYPVFMLGLVLIAVSKAYLFYRLIKISFNREFDPERPFIREAKHLLTTIAYQAVEIGFGCLLWQWYASWLSSRGISMPSPAHLDIDGADVWLFMGLILYVMGYFFKKGVEMQEENTLTV